MPDLSRENFPKSLSELLALIFSDGKFEFRSGIASEVAATEVAIAVDRFREDFETQLYPSAKTGGIAHPKNAYCLNVARLINEDLYQYLVDEPPAMWNAAQRLLGCVGLHLMSPLKDELFYRHAGHNKPPADLSNKVFSNNWR